MARLEHFMTIIGARNNEQIYWNKFEGSFIRGMYGLCIMGDRHYTYYDGMAILVVVDGLPIYVKIKLKESWNERKNKNNRRNIQERWST